QMPNTGLFWMFSFRFWLSRAKVPAAGSAVSPPVSRTPVLLHALEALPVRPVGSAYQASPHCNYLHSYSRILDRVPDASQTAPYDCDSSLTNQMQTTPVVLPEGQQFQGG